ncbi:NADH:flavin oxidoreductase [Labrys sp. La1]|uniref:NADH:flavin oxidoreductase n=1 Tax=Labrys sp. La1 TaxID=3404917 RepID=UPI003EBDDB8F
MAIACADGIIRDRLFAPFAMGNLALANRIAMAPMSRYFCLDGVPHDQVAAYYRRRAENEVGLIITEATYIGHPTAPSYEGVPWFHGEAALAGWARVCAAVHAVGGKIIPQLWHTGSFRNSSMGPQPGVPGVGPSQNLNAFTGHPEATRPMSLQEIAEVIAAFADAAGAARKIGFDGIEIHGAHGYLIDEFLWGTSNRRVDRYGGDRRNRTRFAVEVVKAIRDRVGPDLPISFRYSQWKQQDYKARLAETPAELADILEPLAAAGVSLFHCSTRRLWEPAFPEEGDMTLAGWTRKIAGLPVIAVGGAGLDRAGLNAARAASLAQIEKPLERGEFDILAVGRALLADPAWVRRVKQGRAEQGPGYTSDLLDTLI